MNVWTPVVPGTCSTIMSAVEVLVTASYVLGWMTLVHGEGYGNWSSASSDVSGESVAPNQSQSHVTEAICLCTLARYVQRSDPVTHPVNSSLCPARYAIAYTELCLGTNFSHI